jgi:hypothetical protein
MSTMIPAEKYMAGQTQQCKRLANVLTITKQMLAFAEQDNWDQVTECELERREDLGRCFSDTQPAADAELIAEAMAALLHLNEELMALLKVARTKVMEQGQAFSRQRSAASSYREMDAAR